MASFHVLVKLNLYNVQENTASAGVFFQQMICLVFKQIVKVYASSYSAAFNIKVALKHPLHLLQHSSKEIKRATVEPSTSY